MLNKVPYSFGGFRLFLVDPLSKIGIETQEVDEFAGRIDLGLIDVFAGCEHGPGVDLEAILNGKQLSCFEEDSASFLPPE